ncbi:MAG: hypothetical protein Q8P67_18765 [archaeon]|nr:hypothetical protein [archaeon]
MAATLVEELQVHNNKGQVKDGEGEVMGVQGMGGLQRRWCLL